mmetsp:Transcript_25838/g.70958  ORF Transcript_25838/g.70958 Transcript_25838/m.70958 type:complete len:220 (+) Transcript_25838:601-1260(+)
MDNVEPPQPQTIDYYRFVDHSHLLVDSKRIGVAFHHCVEVSELHFNVSNLIQRAGTRRVLCAVTLAFDFERLFEFGQRTLHVSALVEYLTNVVIRDAQVSIGDAQTVLFNFGRGKVKFQGLFVTSQVMINESNVVNRKRQHALIGIWKTFSNPISFGKCLQGDAMAFQFQQHQSSMGKSHSNLLVNISIRVSTKTKAFLVCFQCSIEIFHLLLCVSNTA